ncbi:MAG: DUF5723 family protein [Bacteroidota bacterium]
MKHAITLFFIVTASWLMFTIQTRAQHDLGSYQLGNVPQRIFQNPAFIPIQKSYIGLPAISGIQAAYANPFTYNDILSRDGNDSLNFNVENFLSKMSKNHPLSLNSSVNILSVGSMISKDRFFIDFSIRERVSQSVMLPENLFNLLWYGNAAPQLFGNHVNILPVINAVAYDEYGFTFAGYAMKKRLTYGVTVKYLSGRFNINTRKSEFDFYTDSASYKIHLSSDLEVQTSGTDQIEHYFDKSISSLAFPGNPGFSIDLGLNYQINDKFTVNASLLDLGFINWRQQTLTMVSHDPNAEFNFNGLTVKDFTEMFKDPAKFGKKVEDTLRKLIHIDSIYDVSYTSRLPLRFNVGGSYILNDHHRFNLLFNGISWAKTFHPALSASYNFTYKRFLELMVSYNVFNNQYTNIGGGVSISAGPIQLYLISDNIPGLIFYKSTNNYSFQFGLNIVLGKKSANEVVPEIKDSPELEKQENQQPPDSGKKLFKQ